MAKKKNDDNLVEVELFKDTGKYKGDVTVGLNGKIWQIKRGVKVKVPREVREILDHSKYQDEQTANMISEMESEYLSKNI